MSAEIQSSCALTRPIWRRSAIFLPASVFLTFMAASSAPTPLYRLYQENWGFSSLMLTVIFGVYALSLLVALLTAGSLSDYLGRRPVILASLALEIVAMLLFWRAEDVSWLLGARILQGIATGIAASSLGAAILDGDKQHGPLINGVVPLTGMGGGALAASMLVAYAPLPMRLVFLILIVIMLLQMSAVALFFKDSVERRAGALASLRPTIEVPPQARRALLLVTPVNVAVWALGGFYLSLVPSLVKIALATASPLAGGMVVAVLTSVGAVSILLLRRQAALRLFRIGAAALILGPLIILLGVHTASATALFAGTAVAGVGFGLGFLGSLRTVLPLAHPGERAGLMSAFYVLSYLANCVPSILAGLLAQQVGLILATDCYGLAVAVLSLAALLATGRL